MYDFISLLYVYNEFINADIVKKKRFKQIQEFVDGRAVRNREYFEKMNVLKQHIHL